ncbi:MAG: hypothetical protein JO001_20865 [Alphaproteobacteria bacterium]|nr:hypothetical protein [Alphaproteobacteria bacterium]
MKSQHSAATALSALLIFAFVGASHAADHGQAGASASTIGAGSGSTTPGAASGTIGTGGSAAAGGTSASSMGLGATSSIPGQSSSTLGTGGSASSANGGNDMSHSAVHGSGGGKLHGQSMDQAHEQGGVWSKSHTQTKVNGDDLTSRTKSMAHEPGGPPVKSTTTSSTNLNQ